jgi:hypothetical protein
MPRCAAFCTPRCLFARIRYTTRLHFACICRYARRAAHAHSRDPCLTAGGQRCAVVMMGPNSVRYTWYSLANTDLVWNRKRAFCGFLSDDDTGVYSVNDIPLRTILCIAVAVLLYVFCELNYLVSLQASWDLWLEEDSISQLDLRLDYKITG